VNLDKALERIVFKFSRRASLQESDVAELLRLPFTQKVYDPGRYLVREGAPTHDCVLLLDGFAYRHKLTADGERQIVSVHIAGDFIDLEGSLLSFADHNAQALTRCEVATIPAAAIVDLIDRHPRIGRAMWVDTLIDGSIFREWIMNVGRRPAKQRIAHLLCELGRRQEAAGIAERTGYDFPMTQEHLADATGLTPVHVNRTLRALDADGLIEREKRHVRIPDWERLRDVAGFSELYLHLDQVV
jgi:CRP-like cAMP-binding protein